VQYPPAVISSGPQPQMVVWPQSDIARIAKRVEALRRFHSERDARHMTVYDVRTGKIDNLMPGTMPDVWPKPIVANAIDVAARQMAENLAPLPAINCANGVVTSERQRKYVAKKTKVAHHYVDSSQLKKHMPQACDWYLTYGLLPFVVEPDFTYGSPRIRIDNPMKCYPQYDLAGRVISYTKVWREEAWRLADKFPMHATAILGRQWGPTSEIQPDTLLECVKYCDKDSYVLYLPERNNLVLADAPNPFGKVPVAIARKPSYDDQDRGQFDDVIYPYLARARMALLGLQGTQRNVRAPLAIPTDIQKVPFGDDAILRTNSPEKIRRITTDLPVHAFQQEAVLQEEIRQGTRTPAAATGDVSASIITGKGVEALQGGYDTQIATGQAIIGGALEQALSLCFEMDESYWPSMEKSIQGMVNGTPFNEKYTPERDIKGDYTVNVSYGFAAGMNPNQALIFLLQLRGDQDISRDFLQRQLPMDIDVTAMQAQIDNEQVTDALKQGVFAMLASAGIMAQQGMDPTQVLARAASIIELREKGTPMHEAILKAFAPEPVKTPAAAAAATQGGAPEGGGPGGGQGVPFGINPGTGLPGGTAPGQAQLGPGGKPDLMSLLAGLSSSGRPQLSASVKRQVPA
jgi:hypothetical protein